MSQPQLDIASLTIEERFELLEQLSDSLTVTPEAVPLPEDQRAELDRRLDCEGPVGFSWDEMLEQIRNRQR